MINAPQLLADLKRQLTLLEADLRERINALPELKASLDGEWQAARDVHRTAETFESWSDQAITQAGVHWLLSCVFLRFIEDNTLIDRPWISGTPLSGRLSLAGTGSVQFLIQVIDLKDYKSHGNKVVDLKKTML